METQGSNQVETNVMIDCDKLMEGKDLGKIAYRKKSVKLEKTGGERKTRG